MAASLAVAARWQGSIDGRGARLHPNPDAVEYAAVAQTLARSGEAYLQLGPYRVRSRYPPGWPLLLAPAVLAGVPARELWRVTGLFGAGLACLVAAGAAVTASALAPPNRRRVAWWVAGLLGGVLWALAPLAVGVGRLVMSDEPAAAATAAAVACAIVALRRARSGRGLAAPLAGGGLAWGAALAMRPVTGILVAPALALLAAGIARAPAGRARERWRGAVAWALGAAVLPVAVCLVLVRSGIPAWEWSGYHFWTPSRFGDWSAPFRLPGSGEDSDVAEELTDEGWKRSHAARAMGTLLGIPPRCGRGVGMVWPALGWIAAVLLARRAERQNPGLGAPWVIAALLVWVVGHLLFFSAYFFPAARFYLAPAAVPVAAFAAACGLGVAGTGRRRAAAAAAATVALVASLGCFLEVREQRRPPRSRDRTRASFNRWLKRGDAGRAGRVMPFDPVRAQALGLLTPEVADRVRVWGELPPTVHVRRLRASGYLPRAAETVPAEPRAKGGSRRAPRGPP